MSVSSDALNHFPRERIAMSPADQNIAFASVMSMLSFLIAGLLLFFATRRPPGDGRVLLRIVGALLFLPALGFGGLALIEMMLSGSQMKG
jgi:hypothetical protein